MLVVSTKHSSEGERTNRIKNPNNWMVFSFFGIREHLFDICDFGFKQYQF